jgi:hypothetical protein
MIEKLIFGDTNLLYGVVIACIPLAVLALCRRFVTARRALGTTVLLLLLPVGNFSFANYLANAGLGYSEALGCGLFLTGLALLIRAQPTWGGTKSLPLAAAAGALLAASMIVRPNFALAVAWCGAACAWSSLRRGDVRSSIAVSAGLALALWMPFHNWFYGGEFYLVGRTQSLWLALGVGDYTRATIEVLDGRPDSAGVMRVSQQLRAWLGGPGFVDREWLMPLAWATHVVKLGALLVTAWVAVQFAVRSRSIRPPLGVMAVAALLAHVPMLFIWETPARYAMLAWDLCLLVLLVNWRAAPAMTPAAAEDNQLQ